MPDANAMIGMGVELDPGATEVFRTVINQIRGVQSETTRAIRNTITTVSAMYARRPKIPIEAQPAVAEAVAAMKTISEQTDIGVNEFKSATTKVQEAIAALLGPFAQFEGTTVNMSATLKAMPPNLRRFAIALFNVSDNLGTGVANIAQMDEILKTLGVSTRYTSDEAARFESREKMLAQIISKVTGLELEQEEAADLKAAAYGRTIGVIQRLIASIRGLITAKVKSVQAWYAKMKAATETSRIYKGTVKVIGFLTASFKRLIGVLFGATEATDQFGRSNRLNQKWLRSTVQHGYATIKTMDILSSAFQGIMLGTSLMQGQLIGVAMSLFFLRMSILPLFAAFAGLTMAFLAVAKVIGTFTKNLREAGRAAQDTLLQFRALTQSMAEGTRLWGVSASWAIRYGRSIDETRKAMTEFMKVGLMNDDMMKASAALAAAWNMELTEAASILAEAVGEEERNVDSLRKYGITVDGVTKTTDRMTAATAIANATLNRFGDTIDARLRTISGSSQRAASAIKYFWEAFTEPVATNVVAPLINMFANFFATLGDLITGLWKSRKAQEYFNETLRRAGALVKEYRPEITMLGNIIRLVVTAAFWALQYVLRGVVTLAEKFFRWVRAITGANTALGRTLKPIIDMLRQLGQAWKAITMQNLLQKAKELYANIIAALGPLGTAIDTIIKAAIKVWNEKGEQLISDFLLALFSVSLWNKLVGKGENVTRMKGIGTALRIAFVDFAIRTLIESLPVEQTVKDTLNKLFDFTIWGMIAAPIVAGLAAVVAKVLGLGLASAITGAPAWVILGIGALIGTIIGILDSKFNLGIHDWIVNTIPQNKQDWINLWENVKTTFTEKVIPFITVDLPAKLAGIATSISDWLNKPIRLPTWEEIWSGITGFFSSLPQRIADFLSGINLGEVLGKLFDWGVIGAALGPVITGLIGTLGAFLYNKFAIAFPLAAVGFLPGWAAAAIGGLVGIVISILDKHFGLGIRDFITTKIPEFLGKIPEAIGNFISGIEMPDFVTNILGTIGEIDLSAIFGEFKLPDFEKMLSPLISNFQGVLDVFGEVKESFGNWVDRAGPFFGSIWENIGLAVEFASDIFGKAKDAVGEFISEAAERLGPIIKPWIPVVQKIGRLLVRIFSKAIERTTKTIRGLMMIISTISRIFITFVGTIISSAMKIGAGVMRLLTPAIQWITNAFRTMWEWVGPIIDSLWQAVQNAAGIIGATLGTLIGIISSIFGGIVDIFLSLILDGPEAAKEAFLDMVGNIANLIGGWVEDVSEKIGDLKSNLEDAWDKIKRRALAIWEDVKEKVKEKWDEIKQNAKDKFEEVRSNIETKIEEARAKVQEKVEEMLAKAKEKWEEIKDKAKEIWEDIRSKINEKIDEARQNIQDRITEAKKWLTDKVGIVADFLHAGEDLIGNLRDGAKKLFDDPLGFLATVFGKVAEAITGLLEKTQLDEWVKAGAEFVVNLVKGWVDKITGEDGLLAKAAAWLKSIADTVGIDTDVIGKWVTLGTNLIKGIISGIWSWLTQGIRAIVDFIASLKEAGEDEADSGSPAKAFMPLGQSIVEGILKPIYEAHGAVDDAVKGLIGTNGVLTVPVIADVSARGTGYGRVPYIGSAPTSSGVNISIVVTGNTFGGGDESVFAEGLADEIVDRLRLRGIDTTRRF